MHQYFGISVNILSFEYHVNQTKVQLLPSSVMSDEVKHVHPQARVMLPANKQISLLRVIQLKILKGHVFTISRIEAFSF